MIVKKSPLLRAQTSNDSYSAEQQFSKQLFEFCDVLLLRFVERGPEKFCAEMSLAFVEEAIEDFVRNARALKIKSTEFYLAHSLRSMYNACQNWQKVTPVGVSTRMQTFLGLFERLRAEKSFDSESAVAAARIWG
jgi:hypothetical protein